MMRWMEHVQGRGKEGPGQRERERRTEEQKERAREGRRDAVVGGRR